MAVPARPSGTGNWILDGLSSRELANLRPVLALRRFDAGSVVRGPRRSSPNIYFVRRGVAVNLVRGIEGGSVIASVVGHDGVIGLPLWLGDPSDGAEWQWLMPGEAWRLPVNSLPDSAAPAVHRFAAAQLHEERLASACHLLHSVEQRIARYLLEVAERGGVTELVITHEQLTGMVGVTRPRITAALDHLERASGVFRGRGRVLIRDADHLRSSACDCYESARKAHEAVAVPWSASAPS